MDFSAYPNLARVVESMGKVKQTAFNKKVFAAAEENLQKISDEDYRKIDAEIHSAVQVLGSYVTPTAIIYYSKMSHTIDIILNKDIIYIWGSVQKQTMYFIPVQKFNIVHILTRTGYAMHYDMVNTAGFSKKDICGDTIAQIRNVIDAQYPGILYGWTKEREKAMFDGNIDALTAAVDQVRNG